MYPPTFAERMAVPRLGEASNEDLVASFQEEDLRTDPATLEGPAHGAIGRFRITGTGIQHDCHPGVAHPIGRYQFGEVREQLTGQIVDDDVVEVLEQLGRRRLPSTGQAAQDDDVGMLRPVREIRHRAHRIRSRLMLRHAGQSTLDRAGLSGRFGGSPRRSLRTGGTGSGPGRPG